MGSAREHREEGEEAERRNGLERVRRAAIP
jgi:hypothetical protein